MTIANKLFVINGVVVTDPFGSAIALASPDAPNATDFSEEITIQTPEGGGPRFAIITIPEADYSATPLVSILWHAVDLDGNSITGEKTFAPGAGGVIVLDGGESVVFGRAAGLSITGYELRAIDGDNLMGYSDGIHALGAAITSPPDIVDVLVTGDAITGETLTAEAVDVTGSPTPVVTWEWLNNATPIGGAEASTYVLQAGDEGDSITARATATNSEGAVSFTSDPVVPAAAGVAPVISNEVITGSGFVGGLLTVSYDVTGAPDTVELQWQEDGNNITDETGTTYTPVTPDVTISCEIVATNATGSDTAEPTIEISALEALTAEEWDILTVAAVGSGRKPTRVYIDPAKNATQAWITSAQPESLLIQPFPLLWVEMELEDAEEGWWTPVVSYNVISTPAGGNVCDCFVGGDSRSATGTFTLTASDATTFAVTGSATGTLTVGTMFESGDYRFIVMPNTIAPVSGDIFTLTISTRDFNIYDPAQFPGDTLRQARIAAAYAVSGGANSPASVDVKTVPEIPSTVTKVWYPFQGRTLAEYNAGIVGGQGRQNFKHVARTAADPEVVWFGLDVNGPVKSEDAGKLYISPQLLGMPIQESCAGLWIDPEDADRVIVGVSGADMRSTTTTPNAYDNAAGLYLSLDRGATATHVLQLTNVASCGATGERDNRQLLVALPGGTPTSRTIYYVHKPKPKGGSWATGTLYRSTNGGQAGGWSAHGASLPNATFGNKIYWIDADPSGNLYLGADNGLFKSTNGGTSWTACTGIAGPVNIVNAYHGGLNVWACRNGNGAYKATNAAGTTFSRNSVLGAYDIEAMAVCPANAQRICVAERSNGTDGKRTHNGGTTWQNIINRSSTGDTSDWPSKMCGDVAIFSWTPGSDTEIICQRKQHFGKSIDGGASTDWSGNGTDYQTRRGFDADPLDWHWIVAGTQDTIVGVSKDGYLTEYSGGWTNTQRDTIKNGGDAATGSGGLILRNGSHRAVLSAAGGITRLDRLCLHWHESGVNPAASVTLLGTARAGCEFAGRKAGDNSIGWMGKSRFKLESNGTLTVQKSNMAQEFYGASSTGARIFGGPTSPGNNKTIYVSADSGDTWSAWGTSPVKFAVAYGNPSHAICVSKHSANRVWVGEAHNGTGRIYKMEGSTPTSTLVFTLATYPGFDAPETSIHVIRESSDPDVLYFMAFAAGNPFIFRMDNATTSPTITDITENAPLRAISWMHVHPGTDDIITGGQCGSRVHRCHTGSALPNAGAMYDAHKAFIDANVGAGVEF